MSYAQMHLAYPQSSFALPNYQLATHLPLPPHHLEPSDDAARKRPKYTRSKLGCLTCRTKKVKCDEVKPVCTRCTQAQRPCTWPENATIKRKASATKEETHSESDLVSSSSPPMTRNPSPRAIYAGGAPLSYPHHSSVSPPTAHIPSHNVPSSLHHRRSSFSHNPGYYSQPSSSSVNYSPPNASMQSVHDLQYPPSHPVTPLSAHSGQSDHSSYSFPSAPTAAPGPYYRTTSNPEAHNPAYIPRQSDLAALPPIDMSRYPSSVSQPHWNTHYQQQQQYSTPSYESYARNPETQTSYRVPNPLVPYTNH